MCLGSKWVWLMFKFRIHSFEYCLWAWLFLLMGVSYIGTMRSWTVVGVVSVSDTISV